MSDYKNPEYADEIQITNVPFDTCTKCNLKLIDGIPFFRENPSKTIRGKMCPSCHRYYIYGIHGLDSYLSTHFYLQRFRTRDSNLWVYSKDAIIAREAEWNHRKRLNETPFAMLLLVLEDINNKEHEIVVVSNRNYEDKTHNVLYFWTRTALILLTYAFHPDYKGKSLTVRGKPYKITNIYERSDNTSSCATPQTIYLRKNGGYHDPQHPSYPRVIALVYSPFSNHYEGMAVTKDTDNDIYYVDSAKFRDFIYKYGNPGIQIGFYKKTGGYENRWSDLNDSSFLMDYGYNVSIRDNLPDNVRQQMLSEIVDLKIASVSDIVNHLNFCMSSHIKHPGAISCWQKDKEYISNYKLNPERFLIADNVRK